MTFLEAIDYVDTSWLIEELLALIPSDADEHE
jgi:hypothetical protein